MLESQAIGNATLTEPVPSSRMMCPPARCALCTSIARARRRVARPARGQPKGSLSISSDTAGELNPWTRRWFLRTCVPPHAAHRAALFDGCTTLQPDSDSDCELDRPVTLASACSARRACARSTATSVDARQRQSILGVPGRSAAASSLGMQSSMATAPARRVISPRLSRSEASDLIREIAILISSRMCPTDSLALALWIASSANPSSGTAILLSSWPITPAKPLVSCSAN